jgi:hypothetical protein
MDFNAVDEHVFHLLAVLFADFLGDYGFLGGGAQGKR